MSHRFSDDRIGRIKRLPQRFCRACGKFTRGYKHVTVAGVYPPEDARRCTCSGKYVPGGPRYCATCGGRMKDHPTACGDLDEFRAQDFEEFTTDLESQPGPDDPVWRK